VSNTLRCDGPDCEHWTRAVDPQNPMVNGYICVEYVNAPTRSMGSPPQTGPLHFCSPLCLDTWARAWTQG